MKHAIFPGSFDPFTSGHAEIVDRGLKLFDRITIAIGVNSAKQTMFTADQRVDMIRALYSTVPQVEVVTFTGLTVEFARSHRAGFLLRGLRSAADLEYERSIALLNRDVAPEVDTIFIISSGATSHISSTLVRELIRYGADVSKLVPAAILHSIQTLPRG